MHELSPPPDIAPLDWATTPPAVRALVQGLLIQVQAEQFLLHQQIARLQSRVAELEARLSQHSGNSSRPPSSDPPSAPPRPPKPSSGRKRGAQPGHPGQHRDLLPPEQVTEWEKARGFCQDLLLVWPALWTFVEVEGVEPTNNAAERALRPAVRGARGVMALRVVMGVGSLSAS